MMLTIVLKNCNLSQLLYLPWKKTSETITVSESSMYTTHVLLFSNLSLILVSSISQQSDSKWLTQQIVVGVSLILEGQSTITNMIQVFEPLKV